MTDPSRDLLVSKVGEYVAALNGSDAGALAALFAADAEHCEPVGSPPNRSRDEIFAFFLRAVDIEMRVRQLGPVTVSGRYAAVQLAVAVPGIAEFVTTDVFEYDEDGAIIKFSAFPDLQASSRQPPSESPVCDGAHAGAGRRDP